MRMALFDSAKGCDEKSTTFPQLNKRLAQCHARSHEELIALGVVQQ